MPHGRMQVDRAMRLVAVIVDRDAHHRDVHPEQRDDDIAPETEVREAVEMGVDEVHVGRYP
jgi:hypothetical protein